MKVKFHRTVQNTTYYTYIQKTKHITWYSIVTWTLLEAEIKVARRDVIAVRRLCSFTNIVYLPSNQPSSITLANQSSQTSFGVNFPQPDKYGKITKGHNSKTSVSHRFALPLPLGSAFPLAGPLPLPFVSPLAAAVVFADAVVFDAAFFCKIRK